MAVPCMMESYNPQTPEPCHSYNYLPLYQTQHLTYPFSWKYEPSRFTNSKIQFSYALQQENL